MTDLSIAEEGNRADREDMVDTANLIDPRSPAGVISDAEIDSAAMIDPANRVDGGTARAVLGYIAAALSSDPEAVVIETQTGRTTRFKIHVAPGDMGRMIGRRGRVAQAIRTMVRVAGSRDGIETDVEFVDD